MIDIILQLTVQLVTWLEGIALKKRDAVETKARILSVAEDIFSRVGFDGARVDDIAKEAGVNKALIYYYFKSKDEILETLFHNLVEDAKRMLVKHLEATPDVSSGDDYRKLFNGYISFVTEKKKMIKVAIAESAKSKLKISVVMEMADMIINTELDSIREKYGLLCPEDKQELMVLEFFTGFTPFLNYALYKDQWESYYNISEEELQEKFYQAFKRTHLMAHFSQ